MVSDSLVVAAGVESCASPAELATSAHVNSMKLASSERYNDFCGVGNRGWGAMVGVLALGNVGSTVGFYDGIDLTVAADQARA